MLQFHEVVPVPVLLDALAADTPAVAHRVQRLVLPFYFSGMRPPHPAGRPRLRSEARVDKAAVVHLGEPAPPPPLLLHTQNAQHERLLSRGASQHPDMSRSHVDARPTSDWVLATSREVFQLRMQ